MLDQWKYDKKNGLYVTYVNRQEMWAVRVCMLGGKNVFFGIIVNSFTVCSRLVVVVVVVVFLFVVVHWFAQICSTYCSCTTRYVGYLC